MGFISIWWRKNLLVHYKKSVNFVHVPNIERKKNHLSSNSINNSCIKNSRWKSILYTSVHSPQYPHFRHVKWNRERIIVPLFQQIVYILKLKRILDWKIRNYTLVCLSKINNSNITIRLVIVQNVEVWLNADEVAENDSELFSCVRLCIFHSCFAFIANQLEMCLEIGLFTTPIAWKTWNFKSFYDDELFKEIPVISILTFVLSKICFN